MTIDTHNLCIDFGKHKGERWTRIPVSYLRWIANLTPRHRSAPIAEAELERRNLPVDNCDIEISGHAIDSASLRLRRTWHETKNKQEGLHAWLQRMCTEALEKHEPDSEGRIHWHGIRLVFTEGAYYPTLKTCMPVKTSQTTSTDSDSASRQKSEKLAEWRENDEHGMDDLDDIEDDFHPGDSYALGQD